MYAQDSIDFLKQSGINFEKHQAKGIEVYDFGELIMSSGLVMNEEVKWISFHGSYDFGYLLKLLTCASLPDSETQFFELLHDYFPALYDIKYLLRNAENLRINAGSSLQKIAEHLDVSQPAGMLRRGRDAPFPQVHRIGPQHQAGSDSLVTCRTFFKLMAVYFDNQIDDSKFSGIIYGLGQGYTPPIGSSHSLSNTPAPAGSAAARGVSSPALSGLPHQGPGGQQAPSSPGPVASEDGAGGLGRSHSYAASPGPLGLGAREFPGGSPGAERSPALSPQLDPGASTPNPRGAGGGAAPHAVTPQPGGGTGSVALSGVVNGPSGYPMLEMRRPASPDAQRPGAGSYDRVRGAGSGVQQRRLYRILYPGVPSWRRHGGLWTRGPRCTPLPVLWTAPLPVGPRPRPWDGNGAGDAGRPRTQRGGQRASGCWRLLRRPWPRRAARTRHPARPHHGRRRPLGVTRCRWLGRAAQVNIRRGIPQQCRNVAGGSCGHASQRFQRQVT